MRVLTVAAQPPWPPHDGTRLRSWHLLNHLARTDEVTLLTWSHPGDGTIERIRTVAAELICLPLAGHRRGRAVRLGRRLRALAGAPPPWIQAAIEERGGRLGLAVARAEVSARHRLAPFDIVVAESEAAAMLAPRLAGVPFVVHRHNVFTVLMAALGTPGVELGVWRRFDRATAVADVLVATTPESAAALAAIAPGVPVRVVPNGAERRPPVPAGARRDVVFVGGLDYAPNRQGLDWFLRRVWPLVERPPACELVVVGSDHGHRISATGVRVVGYAADLDAALATAAVGVVPLRAGMGVKNKTLDLLARAIPAVTTSVGAEGLAGTTGIVVADEPAAFARAVSTLLADPTSAVALGEAGRSEMQQRWTWAAAARTYRDVLSEVTRSRSEARP